ncbi:MAG: MATE family efflux transporter [Nannocystales bacterium]
MSGDVDTHGELRALLKLGLPAAGTQLAAMLLGVVDTMMVGRVSTHALDAVALGHLWIYGTMIFGMGLIWGMDPLMSQAHGAGDNGKVARTLHSGFLLVVLLIPPLWWAWSQTEAVMLAFGQAPELAAAADVYVTTQLYSMIPFLLFLTLRQYLQSRGIVMPALWVMVVANVFNVAANWALIFGHLGFEAQGLVGAARATAATRAFTLFGLLVWILVARLYEGAWERPTAQSLSLRGVWTIVKLGLPIGLQYMLEGWAFQVSTLLSGRLGEAELAAHTIALNLASLTFMLPMGLSLGVATRVGNLVGAGLPKRAQHSARLSLMMGAGIMVASAMLFVLARDALPYLYTEDIAVVVLAASILPIAGAFQVFDGIQVVGGAILRGVGSTRPAAVFNLVAYYALGLPLGIALTFGLGWGLRGLWTGLAVGLAIVAGILLWWIFTRVRFVPLDDVPDQP